MRICRQEVVGGMLTEVTIKNPVDHKLDSILDVIGKVFLKNIYSKLHSSSSESEYLGSDMFRYFC